MRKNAVDTFDCEFIKTFMDRTINFIVFFGNVHVFNNTC